MERTEKITSHEDVDETLITPRFDREESAEAQPVVPLAVVSGEARTFDAAHANASVVRRKTWPLALVLASALTGGVLGGAGLYFYQKSQQAEAAPAPSDMTTEQASVPADAPPPSTLPSPAEAAVPSSPTPEEVEAVEDETEEPVVVESEKKKEKKKDSDKKDDDASKRTKKEARDEEPARGERRPRRVNEDARASSDDEEDVRGDEERQARRVDSIVYERERRRQRRQRRQPAVDRIRGIFEGQPER